jgi:methoxymalonate biosynthesis protein
LISNTSGIPIDEMADAVDRPGDLVGTHFMNPTTGIPCPMAMAAMFVPITPAPSTASRSLSAGAKPIRLLSRRAPVISP